MSIVVLVLISILGFYGKITAEDIMRVFLLVIGAFIGIGAGYGLGYALGFKRGAAHL